MTKSWMYKTGGEFAPDQEIKNFYWHLLNVIWWEFVFTVSKLVLILWPFYQFHNTNTSQKRIYIYVDINLEIYKAYLHHALNFWLDLDHLSYQTSLEQSAFFCPCSAHVINLWFWFISWHIMIVVTSDICLLFYHWEDRKDDAVPHSVTHWLTLTCLRSVPTRHHSMTATNL